MPLRRLEIHSFSEIRLRRCLIDLHLDPYYGEEEETEAQYSSKAKRGTTSFHAYATLYVRVRNKRYILAVRQLTAGETTGDVLGEFLELLDGLDLLSAPLCSPKDQFSLFTPLDSPTLAHVDFAGCG
jgi:hypothetical protein